MSNPFYSGGLTPPSVAAYFVHITRRNSVLDQVQQHGSVSASSVWHARGIGAISRYKVRVHSLQSVGVVAGLVVVNLQPPPFRLVNARRSSRTRDSHGPISASRSSAPVFIAHARASCVISIAARTLL